MSDSIGTNYSSYLLAVSTIDYHSEEQMADDPVCHPSEFLTPEELDALPF